jgi:hypothetical protein
MSMRPDSRPVVMTIHLPPLADEAVVEIHDFLSEVLHLFEAHYGGQIHRYYEDRSFENIVQRSPRTTFDDPPF